jgi:hypothetical protein
VAKTEYTTPVRQRFVVAEDGTALESHATDDGPRVPAGYHIKRFRGPDRLFLTSC